MKSILAEIVLQNIEFFSLSADSEVQPDVAVRQLECMGALLKGLPESELNGFLETAKERLEQLRSAGAPIQQIELLEKIRECMGI
jgi:hypothetical protein